MGLWGWPWGRRGPSGFGSASTAEEVTAGVDASNLTAIVTGATNGIGKETARVLALRGAKVIIPARTLESGLKVKESLADQVPSSKLHVMEMDLSSLSSVCDFARSFISSHHHLNLLINNAGIMGCPYLLSKDGIELQFATNHVGHFLLTNLLLNKMKSTARETGVQGRIINVSSLAHKRSDSTCFEPSKLNDKTRYQPFTAYARSKLANILHANDLSRRFQEEGCNLTANSLHPGMIITNIIRYVAANNSALISILSPIANLFLKSIPQSMVSANDGPPIQWWLEQRRLLIKPLRKGFDTLFALVSWTLWKERNARTFDTATATPSQLHQCLLSEARCWSMAGYNRIDQLLLHSA